MARYCIDCTHFKKQSCGMCHYRDSWKPKEKEMEIIKRNCNNCNFCKLDGKEVPCRNCNITSYPNWKPTKHIIKISEEQARDMYLRPGINPEGIDITIKLWKEKGYIIEELKPCAWCGCAAKSNNKVTCTNEGCFISKLFLERDDWNKRS